MKNTAKSEPIDYSDPGKYALKALTDAVNKLKEECRRTGRPLIVWDPKKKKVVEKYYRRSKVNIH
ncbi:MAG: hypothetical protein WAX69_21025 [Victivallales bacterium]